MGEIVVKATELNAVMQAERSCYRKKRNPDGTYTVWYRATRSESDVRAQIQALTKPASKSKPKAEKHADSD